MEKGKASEEESMSQARFAWEKGRWREEQQQKTELGDRCYRTVKGGQRVCKNASPRCTRETGLSVEDKGYKIHTCFA